MHQEPLARIAELEVLIRQKDIQLSLRSKTEVALRHALKQAEENQHALQRTDAELRQLLKEAEEKAEAREREIEELRAQVDKLRRMQFGSRSEKLHRAVDTLEAELDALEQESDELEGRESDPQLPRPLRQSRHRRPLPEQLPREIKRLLPEEECCPQCGGGLSYLGEDSAEQLDLMRSALKVIRTIREKHACVKCDCIVQAPAPTRPIERGIAGAALLARVGMAKYGEHMPLYRQSEGFERQGVHLSRSLLSSWIDAICRLMRPLYESLYNYVMGAYRLHVDETPVPVLEPGKQKTKKGYLWTYVRDELSYGSEMPRAVWFAYTPGRHGLHAEEHLARFRGQILQVDAYAGYNKLFTEERLKGPPLKKAACLAHARRKINDIWVKAQRNLTLRTVMSLIAELYAIEDEIRGQSAEQRRVVRQSRSMPVMESLKALVTEKQKHLSQKSRLGKAFSYIENHWEALCYFCRDGHAEIDNNTAERALRAIAVGRKNYLFFGSDHGGERGALMYSLIGTCKLNHIDPEAYLCHVLNVLPDWPSNRVDELLPWNVDLTLI